MSIVPGSKIGKFKLQNQLGGGGMGSVYKARDTQLGRIVAIKILNSQYDYNIENIERFEREARTLASLNHPNLMHVYDVGIEGSIHYFAMEYIEGKTLSSLIDDPNYELTQQEALRITIEIMAGLRKVHNSGIIHRDIKPANIMIENTDGRAVLVDFGLSKYAEDSGLTSAGSILGTPDYISPEQIEGIEAGYQSDIYSLGVVLYEMICGSNPFTRDSSMQTIRAHCNFTPPPLRKVEPKTPKELSKVVEKMLLTDPKKRYQSIAELAADLLNVCQHPLLTQLTTSPGPAHRPESSRQPENDSARPRSNTPYKHYMAQAPTIKREFPFWHYFSGGIITIAVLLLLTAVYIQKQKDSTAALIPPEIKAYKLPVITYTPEGDSPDTDGIINPSVIIQLKNGQHLWGRVQDGIKHNHLIIGLFPKGKAEYALDDIESLIMADSEAVAEKLPKAEDIFKNSYLYHPRSLRGK